MTPLRQRMIRELELHRKAPKTAEAYLSAVIQLAQHYRRSPDQLSIEEIRSYLHYLINYGQVLARDQPALGKCAKSAGAASSAELRGRGGVNRHAGCRGSCRGTDSKFWQPLRTGRGIGALRRRLRAHASPDRRAAQGGAGDRAMPDGGARWSPGMV
jgi:hypothetical protein